MNEQQTKVKVGWGWPGLSRRAHYFYDGRALCGRWLFFGHADPDTGKDSADDCLTCRRKLRAQQAKAVKS